MHGSRREQRDKKTKQQMKQLIVDLMGAITKACEQKQQLQMTVHELNDRINVLTQTLKSKEQQIARIKQEKDNLQSTIQAITVQDSKKIQQFKYEIEKNIKELRQSNKENEQLTAQLKKRNIVIAELSKKAKESKSSVNQAHQYLTLIKSELHDVKQKCYEKERQHDEEIEQLKDLNNDIKRKFQLIENQYTQILQLGHEKRQQQSPIVVPRIKIINQSNKFDRSTELPPRGQKKGRQSRNPNPELSNELDKIKQEIAAQYNKLNTTKESIMSARVSQTLTRIDTIMSHMSYRIDEESSAYE